MTSRSTQDQKPIDRESLQAYLAEQVGEPRPLSEPELVQGGVSNIVAFATWGDEEIVVRREPPPPIPRGANDLIREFRLLQALQGRARVPKVLLACEDESVLGARFFIMERVHGLVPSRGALPWIDEPGARTAMAYEFVDALAELHSIDYQEIGLGDFARPDGFVERQIRRRYEALVEIMKNCRELPEMTRIHDWLEREMPPQNPDVGILHGDYHMANVMYAADPPPRLVAMIDWEIAAIGDPLTDLGTTFTHPPNMFMFQEPGFPTEEEFVQRYEEGRQRKVEHLTFYKVLQLFRLGVAMEGNYARFVARDDPNQERIKDSCPGLARRAMELAGI